MAHQAAAQPLSKGGIAFFSSLCATTFGLGSWQAQRYFEKIDLVQLRKEELGKEPQQLEKNATCSLVERNFGNESTNANTNTNVNANANAVQKGDADIADVDRGFGPVSVKGKFMHEYEILVGPRGPPPGAISSSGPNSGRSSGGMSSSPQGFFVITPFSRCDDMGIVLVNRGWVPRQYVMQNASWGRPNGVVTVVGVASKTERECFYLLLPTLYPIFMF
jgi:surfeit locus 1 family protein